MDMPDWFKQFLQSQQMFPTVTQHPMRSESTQQALADREAYEAWVKQKSGEGSLHNNTYDYLDARNQMLRTGQQTGYPPGQGQGAASVLDPRLQPQRPQQFGNPGVPMLPQQWPR